MRLDVFFKHNIIQKNKKSFGDNNMILKRNINSYMEKIKNNEISKSEAARKLNCSRQWTHELYNRYINNESLEKQKSHRRKILSNDFQIQLSELYKQLSYESNGLYHTPSMDTGFKRKVSFNSFYRR